MPHSDRPFVHDRQSPPGLFTFHWVAFLQGFRREDTTMPPSIRDGGSGAEIIVALASFGGRYETLFLNHSSTTDEWEKNLKTMVENQNSRAPGLMEDVLEFHPVDVSFAQPGDTVAIVTRLPWNDLDDTYRLHLHPGFTELERDLVRLTRRYISLGYRGKMILASEVADQFSAEYANRGDIEYTQRQGAWYKSLSPVDSRARRTPAKKNELRSAAYILHLPEVECLNGANLLLVFGMGAKQTLAISHRLRRDLSHLLNRWGFTMVEMNAPPEPEHGSTPEWYKSWDMNVILETDVLP